MTIEISSTPYTNTSNNYSHLIVLIIMILLILLFGTYKKYGENIIEYDQNNFKYIESLRLFEKQFEKFNSFTDDYIKITDKINLSNCLIPNMVDIFFVNIKPKTLFFVSNLISISKSKIMVIFDHSYQDGIYNNLSLLINNNYECVDDICGNYGYHYPITKKISIYSIYPIFNNSDKTINFTLMIMKKSYWYF